MENMGDILAREPFLKDMPREYVDILAGCAQNIVFQPGDFIFREGQAANEFYLIRHGRVAVEIYTPARGAITIETLGPGDVLGWSWMVAPYQWRFDARATDLVRAVSLDGKCLRGKCDTNHELGYELLRRLSSVMAQRLQATRLQLLDLYGTAK